MTELKTGDLCFKCGGTQGYYRHCDGLAFPKDHDFEPCYSKADVEAEIAELKNAPAEGCTCYPEKRITAEYSERLKLLAAKTKDNDDELRALNSSGRDIMQSSRMKQRGNSTNKKRG
jgi:hypothetical protein